MVITQSEEGVCADELDCVALERSALIFSSGLDYSSLWNKGDTV